MVNVLAPWSMACRKGHSNRDCSRQVPLRSDNKHSRAGHRSTLAIWGCINNSRDLSCLIRKPSNTLSHTSRLSWVAMHRLAPHLPCLLRLALTVSLVLVPDARMEFLCRRQHRSRPLGRLLARALLRSRRVQDRSILVRSEASLADRRRPCRRNDRRVRHLECLDRLLLPRMTRSSCRRLGRLRSLRRCLVSTRKVLHSLSSSHRSLHSRLHRRVTGLHRSRVAFGAHRPLLRRL